VLLLPGAQKNIGCSGVTLVIVREDLLGSPIPSCPMMLDWTTQVGQCDACHVACDVQHVRFDTCLPTVAFALLSATACVETYHSARVWLCGLSWTGPAGLDGQADKGSMLNTPPTWSIYVAGLVFKWVEAQGGIATFEGALAPLALTRAVRTQ
jgi:phosphoserine aminotransferase